MYPQPLSLKPDTMLTITSSTVFICYFIYELVGMYLRLFPPWFLAILVLSVAATIGIKVHFDGVQRVYFLKILKVFFVSQTLFTVITLSAIKGSGLHYEIGVTELSFYDIAVTSITNFVVISSVVLGNMALAFYPSYRGYLRLKGGQNINQIRR